MVTRIIDPGSYIEYLNTFGHAESPTCQVSVTATVESFGQNTLSLLRPNGFVSSHGMASRSRIGLYPMHRNHLDIGSNRYRLSWMLKLGYISYE
jgi:hypothetical protein